MYTINTTSTTTTLSTTNTGIFASPNIIRSVDNEIPQSPRASDTSQLTYSLTTTQSPFEHCCNIPEILSHILSMCDFKNRLTLCLITKKFFELVSSQLSISLSNQTFTFLMERFQFVKGIKLFINASMYARTLINFINDPNNQVTLQRVESIHLNFANMYSSLSGISDFQNLLNFLSQNGTYARLPQLSCLSFENINRPWFNSFGFPNTLRSLSFGNIDVDQMVLPLLPEGLTHLSFGLVYSNLIIQNFPSTLKYLVFSGICYAYISFVETNNQNANQPNIITIPPFPENLENLCFGNYIEPRNTVPSTFNVPILPVNLKTLSFGAISSDGIVNISKLPDNLINLSFGNIEGNATIQFPSELPNKLYSISFGFIRNNARINLPSTFPENLHTLSFIGIEHSTYINLPKILPKNLKNLSLGYIVDWSDQFTLPKLPDNLNTLSFETIFNSTINLRKLPKNLNSISFGRIGENAIINFSDFPDALNSISFGSIDDDALLSSLILPDNLNYLSLGNFGDNREITKTFNIPKLPINLKTLMLGDIYENTTINFSSLPDTLEFLCFGNIRVNTIINIQNFPNSLKFISFGNIMGKVTLPVLSTNLSYLSFGKIHNPHIQQKLEELQALIATKNTIDENYG